MKKTAVILTGLMVFGLATSVMANEGGHEMGGHDMNGMAEHKMGGHDMKGHDMGAKNGHGDMQTDHKMFLVTKEVDGYNVSFHVMKVKDEANQHGGTHNLMVKVEKSQQTLTDIMVNSKVFHPNKTSETKMLMKMGDWYMAGYDLGHKGKHGIMVLFKTSDGEKHKVSIYYSETK